MPDAVVAFASRTVIGISAPARWQGSPRPPGSAWQTGSGTKDPARAVVLNPAGAVTVADDLAHDRRRLRVNVIPGRINLRTTLSGSEAGKMLRSALRDEVSVVAA